MHIRKIICEGWMSLCVRKALASTKRKGARDSVTSMDAGTVEGSTRDSRKQAKDWVVWNGNKEYQLATGKRKCRRVVLSCLGTRRDATIFQSISAHYCGSHSFLSILNKFNPLFFVSSKTSCHRCDHNSSNAIAWQALSTPISVPKFVINH